MKGKISIILSIFFIIMIIGCIDRGVAPPEERPSPGRMQPGILKKDKLVKSGDEAVEENINAYLIGDDLQITKVAQQDEGPGLLALNQQQSLQMISEIRPKEMNTVLHDYITVLPDEIKSVLQYNRHNISYDYLLVTSEEGTSIRENPVSDSIIVKNIDNLDKVSLLQRIEGGEFNGSSIWYRVGFWDNGRINEGYLHSTEGTPRTFRFNIMLDAISALRGQITKGPLNFVSNYKNQNGAPPSKGDAAVDEYGYRVYHSSPAYVQAAATGDFRYIPDGMLVRILSRTDGFYHVNVPTFDGDFYIPVEYIDADALLSRLNHVVVVDRKEQNQAAFEVTENGLNLVSYTLSTTGFPGEYSFETTLGSYKVIEKKNRFEYLKSASLDIAGYAPFAIRFTGGAYIHGVPVPYEKEDDKKLDPGFTEYLHTIGTFPRSNMCVRNYTSHAEFLYTWMDNQNGAIIVIG